ncbi:hypothetical protein QJS10_CPA03g01025 [Acorus calamus]|uniref:Uncharacterized protein n=1 Tax=Acorus calamus TaxID=4465 RepID=A0AAV9F587_ACOCL|nr:hypothetical protein QJS10_CPA03g01025 [Acorus calamus]
MVMHWDSYWKVLGLGQVGGLRIWVDVELFGIYGPHDGPAREDMWNELSAMSASGYLRPQPGVADWW